MLATSWLSSRRDKELKPLKSVKRTVTRAWSNWVSFSPCSPDRKSTRLNSSHSQISYAVFCLKKKTTYRKIPHLCVIQGDATYASIAAASILAKTYRDDYMIRLHKKFPQYGWKSNKAYATPCHRRAIEEFGLTPFHRRSFQCLPDAQLEMDL